MSRSLLKTKNRRGYRVYVQMPCELLNHPNRLALSAKANKLLLDLCAQLYLKTGGPINNGDLDITWARMKASGWRSKQTLYDARKELERFGFVVQTVQGGKHRPSLYALTWFPVDECGGKLEVPSTRVPSHHWKKPPVKA